VRKLGAFAVCWRILPDVSRSFAVVIRWLPRGLDDAVMVSYLLCRLADTLEDARLPAMERRRLLAKFAGSLDAGEAEMPTEGYSATYRGLLERADAVLACYRSLDPASRDVIRAAVREMCGGMALWADREIVTFEDQNEYCYYVAGLVGRMLTDLFIAHGFVDARLRPQLQPLALSFGLALQKVNVIRDVRADLLDGRCYWPSQLMARHGLSRETLLDGRRVDAAVDVLQEMIRDVWSHAESAVRYLTALPFWQWRLRMFCSIPLFMAVATLGVCWGNPDVFQSDRPVKITSRQGRWIVVRSLAFGTVNRLVVSWFRRWRRTAVAKQPAWPAPALQSEGA